MRTLDIIAMILLIIGGLNWGLVGLFDFNIVAALFGADSVLSNIIYILVGLSAVYEAVGYRAITRRACRFVPTEAGARTGPGI